MIKTILHMLIFVLLADFYLYWQHRCFHWFAPNIHAVHHKRKFAVVFHPIEQALNWLIFPIGWLIGFTTNEMLPVIVWSIIFTFMAHMEKKPHTNRWLFMTAKKHETHHDRYNKNYGTLLTFWDRAARTYE